MTQKKEIDVQTYGIIWARARTVLHIEGTRKKGNEWLGICGFSKRVCKIAAPKDMLSLLVINNLYVTDGVCEEGKRCLDRDCPLNQTTWESLKQGLGLPKKTKKPPHFDERPIDYNANPDGGLNSFAWLFRDRDVHAPGGILDDDKG